MSDSLKTIENILEDLGESYYPWHEYGDSYKDSNREKLQEAKAQLQRIMAAKRLKTDELADSLVEKHYQLRIEHNHYDMKWYAYYAGREQRQLFDDDKDWETMADTPTEALEKLEQLIAAGEE